jgi:hypothetical protein
VSTDPPAGWHDDPFGRHELRYWNGAAWTNDVATAGRRFVDPAPTGPPRPTTPGLAVASVALGVVSIALGWVPYVFVVAVVCGVLAIAFGLRRRRSGTAATVGVVLGVAGLVTCLAGLVFTRVVHDVLDAYRNPGPHRVSIDRCTVESGRAEAAGTIVNDGDGRADYTVTVRFGRVGTDQATRSATVSISDVEPGESRAFDVARTVRVDEVDCRTEVRGPFPFGVQLTVVADTHAS